MIADRTIHARSLRQGPGLPSSRFLAALLVGTLASVASVPVQAQERNDLDSMRTTRLHIAGQPFDVWLAETYTQRQLGLMNVQHSEMAPNQGMLFVYSQDVWNGFWMKNTLIPLDIAWLTADGRIVDIQQMEPLTLDSHAPPGPYRYALEVWQGTFASLGVQPGHAIRIPPEVPTPPGLAGDINADRHVNVLDLQIMAASWNRALNQPGYDPRADFNDDGKVNALDLQVMASNWNQ